MAHLYKRARSPFWWIKTRDSKAGSPTFGQTIRYSTGLRVGVGAQTRKADELEAELSYAEKRNRTTANSMPWNTWVPDYLRARAKSPLTLTQHLYRWRNLCMYLAECHVTSPRQLTREHCLAYLDWRSHPQPRKGKYRACHNTALAELTLLRLIMREAVRRKFATENPVKELGVRAHQSRIKPELTEAHLTLIRSTIEQQPPGDIRTFLLHSFEIARYQGCRLHETYLSPHTDVELTPDGKRDIIRFVIKGGKEHTAPMHPALRPLFQRLRDQGANKTYPPPGNASWQWWNFFHRTAAFKDKLPPGTCFHSLRVTAVTRLARAGITESKAMKFIGHATSLVHRSYQRLRTDDLQDCLAALAADKRPATESPGSTEESSAPDSQRSSAPGSPASA